MRLINKLLFGWIINPEKVGEVSPVHGSPWNDSDGWFDSDPWED